MTLPSLEALHSAGFTFELLGKPWIKELLSAYPYPKHFVSSHFWTMRHIYKKIKPARLILYPNGWSNVLPLMFTGIQSFGYGRSNLQKLFLHRHLQKKAGLHEIEYFWQLTQFTVKKPLPIPQNPVLRLSETYQNQAKDLLDRYAIGQHFYVICPGAMGHGAQKRSKIWPHWQNLCAHLARQSIPLVMCPGPQEIDIFLKQFGQYALILPNINLPLYAAIMQRAHYVIANDSGPMHLAAAVQASVLGVFGQTDPQRTHPWGGHFIGKLNQWPSCDDVLDLLPKVSTLPPSL